MYWYNPNSRLMEDRAVPSTDEEAKRILKDPWFIREYEGWRASWQNIEISMIFTGGTFHWVHTGRRAPSRPTGFRPPGPTA